MVVMYVSPVLQVVLSRYAGIVVMGISALVTAFVSSLLMNVVKGLSCPCKSYLTFVN